MVDVPTAVVATEFSTSGSKVEPSSSLEAAGYLASQQLPAEHMNWFMSLLTKILSTASSYAPAALVNIIAELKTILTAVSSTPNGASTIQVKAALDALYGRTVIKTSGTLGVLTNIGDTEFYLSAATTATAPASPSPNQRITFKNKGNFTSTFTANSGQTIGTTTSISFSIYSQEDYVTFEWDNTSIWYVVATNGPLVTSLQTGINGGAVLSWTAIGGNLTLGTLYPGVYDIEINCGLYAPAGSTPPGSVSIAIGNGTAPISSHAGITNSAYYGDMTVAVSTSVRGYVLTTASTIQGIYYSNASNTGVTYNDPYSIGRITARRIG